MGDARTAIVALETVGETVGRAALEPGRERRRTSRLVARGEGGAVGERVGEIGGERRRRLARHAHTLRESRPRRARAGGGGGGGRRRRVEAGGGGAGAGGFGGFGGWRRGLEEGWLLQVSCFQVGRGRGAREGRGSAEEAACACKGSARVKARVEAGVRSRVRGRARVTVTCLAAYSRRLAVRGGYWLLLAVATGACLARDARRSERLRKSPGRGCPPAGVTVVT